MENISKKVEKINLDYHKITNLLFSNPFLSIKSFEENFNITNRTAVRYIKKLEENNIIKSVKI
jgi:Fic family protein